MNTIELTEMRWKNGLKVLTELNKMSDQQIKTFIGNFVGMVRIEREFQMVEEFLTKTSQTERKIVNEEIQEITISWYDTLEITPLGIYKKSEQGKRTLLTEWPQGISINDKKIII